MDRTYNLRRAIFVKFFKWLYYPDTEPNKRIKPKVVENIAHLKRKEQSIYKPTDLWTQVLFLKYCPNKREIQKFKVAILAQKTKFHCTRGRHLLSRIRGTIAIDRTLQRLILLGDKRGGLDKIIVEVNKPFLTPK